jgi:hypothetical protein
MTITRTAWPGEEPMGAIVFWVIYYNTSDLPGLHVLRRQWVRPGEIVVDQRFWVDSSPEKLRAHIPPGLVRADVPGEDPVILETWF